MPNYDYPYVRDELIVNNTVQAFYDSYAGPGAVVLLARIVRLERDLTVTNWPLVIVADVFEGNGHVIDAGGVDSSVAAQAGTAGAWAGYILGGARDGWPAGPGGDGIGGGHGGDGTPGRSVTLLCREARNVQIKTSGGSGTSGAPGGNGAPGSDGFYREGWTETIYPDPFDTTSFQEVYHDPVDVFGTSGGSGGRGGSGGNGGDAGSITFTRMAEVGTPVFELTGGRAGWGASGGVKGAPGARGEDLAVDGAPGDSGANGADGSLTAEWVSSDDAFGQLIRPTIGHLFANHWAPFRVAMGDHFYRQHNPPLGHPNSGTAPDYAAKAALEFSRALELQPDNAEALRLQGQLAGYLDQGNWVGGGNNALGLPRELDILPQFDAYQGPYNAAVSQLLAFFAIGIQGLIATQATAQLIGLAQVSLAEAEATRDNLGEEVPIAESEKSYAEMDIDYLRKQLDQVRIEIEAKLAAMRDDDFSLGDALGTVAEIGAAVVGVIAAIPSGGASLVGLVPTLVTLSNTVLDGATPLVEAVMSGSEADTKAIEEAYDKVDKKASAVIKSGKTIVNFVSVVQKLGLGTTPENAEHVSLVKQGAAITHELLMAEHRTALADQKLLAAKSKLARAEGVLAEAIRALSVVLTVDSIRAVGQLAISTARSRTDAAARFAFWAQRSVEIYTLQDESQNVHLDAGQVSPEIDRRYYDGEMTEATLVSHLLPSVGRLLDPIGLQDDYLEYFSQQHDPDTLRLSFRGDRELNSLRTHHRFSFHIDPFDLPPNHFDAKIRSIRLAIVGASHPNGEISCEVRHGALYQQRRRDGTITTQRLEPRIATRPAKLEPLAPDEGLGEDPPLTAPRSLAYWGRGIGGTWELSIRDDQFTNTLLDLSGVTWVQVWIGYQ
ncbi:MAG: hypothetical protein WCF12_11155, partial [Propionicimonas sp.]